MRRVHQRGGFTLVELIVVIAVMVTLMGVSFSLMHAGDDAVARNRTLNRLQRLQNCLSGYFAAFGHYPAVPLHASRDWRLKANNYGIQTDSVDAGVDWLNVRAALLAQPVAVEYPFDCKDAGVKSDVSAASKADITWAKSSKKTGEAVARAVLTNGYKPFAASMVKSSSGAGDWREVQVYRHGLLAYLLPRVAFMLRGESSVLDGFAAWTAHNDLAEYYDSDTGKALTSTWAELADAMRLDSGRIREAALASSAAATCARWLPNLEGVVRGGGTFFGIDTGDGMAFRERERDLRDAQLADLHIHAPGSAASPNAKSQYILDGMTVLDGWGGELYYYSPAPHRACRVWSAGRDRRTFPPWVDPKAAAKDAALAVALGWTCDDLAVELK